MEEDEDEIYLDYEYKLVRLAEENREEEFKAWIKDIEKEYFFKDLLQDLIIRMRFIDNKNLCLFLIEKLRLI